MKGLKPIANYWATATLGELSEVKSGVGFPKIYQGQSSGDYPVYKVGDVSRAVTQSQGLLKAANHYVTTEEAGALKGAVFRTGSTLFAKIGEAVKLNRRAFIIRPGLADNNVMAVVPLRHESDKYLYYFLRTIDLSDVSRSTTVPSVRKGDIEDLIIPLPPLAEQKVIADKLDTLLAQVENTKARLERIPQILKRFRQSVLAAAVSGRLTKEWRTVQGNSPDSWRSITFNEICREITVGFVGRMANRYKEYGIPFLRSQNVRAFKYSDKNLLFISTEFHKEIYKSRLEPGDLAIVRSGAPGTTCVIPESLGVANCSDLVIARPSRDLIPEFGCIFMNSEVAQKNVSENQVGVAQQHFNVGSMKKMPIHLPPVEEQTEIVRRVDQLFAHADRIEQQVNNALARVNNLTQSILAKAFRGELTVQWRKNNPDLISGENSAEALLERITAEKAASKPAKKARKQTTA